MLAAVPVKSWTLSASLRKHCSEHLDEISGILLNLNHPYDPPGISATESIPASAPTSRLLDKKKKKKGGGGTDVFFPLCFETIGRFKGCDRNALHW